MPIRRPSHRFPAAAVAAVAVLFAAAPAAGAEPWRLPVQGEVTRPFDLGADAFEAGRHRGIDLAARPGAVVRAPCAGPVAFAGAAGSSGRVVTLRCGPWRVTHLPLASIAVRAGGDASRGAALGSVAASADHAGLHFGVRREGARFGYVDPLRFLGAGATPTAPPLGRAPRPLRPPPTGPPPRPIRMPPARPALRPHGPPPTRPALRPLRPPPSRPAPPPPAPARPVAGPAGSNPGVRAPFAPWPAWVGLALVLAGAGLRLRWRMRAAGTLARAESTGGSPCRS